MTRPVLKPDFAKPAAFAPIDLPVVATDAALSINRAIRFLNGADLGDLIVAARPAEADEIAGEIAGERVVFSTPKGTVHVAPRLIDGAPFRHDDHASLLAAVSRLEPLFAALEKEMGALDPTGVTREPAHHNTVHLSVDLRDRHSRIRHGARLTLPLDHGLPDRASSGAAGPDLHLSAAVSIDGPMLSLKALAGLGAGDIVLIPSPAGGWRARLAVRGATMTGLGRIDPQTRLYIHQSKEPGMSLPPETDPSTPHADAASRPAPDGLAPNGLASDDHASDSLAPAPDASVAVAVHLGDVAVPLKSLTSLAPGSTLALPELDDDLSVDLSSAGRVFARGRLVSLGQARGVVIDSIVAARPDAAMATGD